MAAVRKFHFPKMPVLASRELDMARLRFAAWWDGADFDESAARAQIAAWQNERAMIKAGEIEPPRTPRLAALEVVWGENRIAMGDAEEEAAAVALLGLQPESSIVLFGGGMGEPAVELARASQLAVSMYEWRPGCVAAAQNRLARLGLSAKARAEQVEPEAAALPDIAFDAAWSRDELTFVFDKRRLTRRVGAALKPGGVWLVDELVGDKRACGDSAFAAAWSDPHLWRSEELLAAFQERGLTLESETDITSLALKSLKTAVDRIEDRINFALQRAKDTGFGPAMLRELAWEAETIKGRERAFAAGAMARIRFMLRKTAA